MISNSYHLSGVPPSLKVLGRCLVGIKFLSCYILFVADAELTPSQFVEVGVDEKYWKENMFMACIKFINEVWLVGEALH